MVNKGAPDRGDIIWLDFDPTRGHEQKGTRPALVVSPKLYNDRSSLLLACPMTTKVKGYPYEVRVKLKGKNAAILVDQIKSLDWQQRVVSRQGKVDESTMKAVLAKLSTLTTDLG